MSGLQAVKLAGGIMPPALLGRIQAGDVAKDSLTPASYHLAAHETVRDAAARSWSYLRGAYTAWREADDARQPGSSGTGLARDRWLLPLLRELGYGTVPALTHGYDVEDTHYPISHAREHIPVHLLGPDAALDRRNPGMLGAARAPQAMVQEYLNRSDAHLWAVLSNGLRLRLLRDSTSLAGSAYIEFDLEAIFTGELYAEFLLLFQVAHQSRVEKRGGVEGSPADCWMEDWRAESVTAGTRALDKLRDGVEAAIGALGTGFLRHPDNRWLVTALRDGRLTTADYHRALLRLAYRLLFTFVAEDRDALLDPAATPEARARYADYFSTARLRRLSNIRRGGSHPDLWQAQRLVLAALGGDGLPQLGVPALGGLYDPDPRAPEVPDQPHRDLLHGAELANHDLLTAIRALAWVAFKGERRQPVDYAHLGAEELGSVYESLLELVPRIDLDAATFTLTRLAGNERKTTGSYYTPPALVSALLDTALDPVLDAAITGAPTAAEAERRLLAVTVCDPASGSGGFLVAAARRIARRLAQLRAGEDEPTPEAVQHALSDVVGRCIYGVDLNDLAAELAKVSLWLEALEPGKPLGFLDARIRVGNSLIGTTPALLAAGVPDEAFKEITGDDKAYAGAVRRKNKTERSGQAGLFDLAGEVADVHALAAQRAAVLAPADHIRRTRAQAAAWAAYEHSDALRRARLHADAWTAAFVWPLRPDAPPPPTTDVLAAIARDPDSPALAATVAEVGQLAEQYRFFHWHLEFPEVFGDPGAPGVGPDGWPGGFTCLLGNPPWEHIELKEQEYFQSRAPEIAEAAGAKRKRMINQLPHTDPPLAAAYARDKRHIDALRAFTSDSGRYPLTGRGRVKTDTVFAELWRALTHPNGRSGVIVPTGIATDATTQYFFKDLVTTGALAALYDFENRAAIFPDVDSRMKFCLLTMAGRNSRESAADFAFFLHDPGRIREAAFALTPAEITLLNPNTGTCPVFRTRRDAEITLGIYGRVPVLINEDKVAAGETDGNPWGVSFMQGLFNMTSDSHLFATREQLESDGWTLVGTVFERLVPVGVERMLPLYEAKMIHHFNHRWATYEGKTVRDMTGEERRDPSRFALPRYWVPEGEVSKSLGDRWDRRWLMGWRDIARSTDERTTIASAVGQSASPEGGTLLMLPDPSSRGRSFALLAILDSFAFDFSARQKVGGTHLKFFTMRQLPALPPDSFATPTTWVAESLDQWVRRRVLELTYTAWDMAPFAEDLGDVHESGRVSPPFVWDDERRFWLRAELDAAIFHLYGIARDDVDYIMNTFPIVRRKDEATHGEYRTKCVILELFDAMQTAIDTCVPYTSPIDPPPGHGPRHPDRRTP